MVDEETERRLEAAAQDASRQKEVSEFLESLKPGDELVRPIYNPEAVVFREKYRGMASRGELPKTKCRHPMDLLQQYVDDDSQRGGSPGVAGRPVNLFICGVCQTPLWLVDPWGETVSDLVSH
jgi:hypothetical protein